MANPLTYTQELSKTICGYISQGMPLTKICDLDGMPSLSTVFDWLNKFPEFEAGYIRAREAQMDYYAEEISQIADNAGLSNDEIQKARLQIETRKWLMSKIKAKKYADRIEPTTVNNYTDNRKVDVNFERLKLAPKEFLNEIKKDIADNLIIDQKDA